MHKSAVGQWEFIMRTQTWVLPSSREAEVQVIMIRGNVTSGWNSKIASRETLNTDFQAHSAGLPVWCPEFSRLKL